MTSKAKPKIFCFSNRIDGGEGPAYAMAEDGTVLGAHYCSHETFVPGDLGVIPGSRPDRHERYAQHYPDGYEMEFVPSKNVRSHPGLLAAIELNRKQGEDAKKSNS